MIEQRSNKPNLILLGAPGAGKGSLAKKLVRDYGYFQLSTGDMFREEIALKTTIGKKIEQILANGSYVDDKLTNQLVKDRLEKLTKNNTPFILDGYPRTTDQANFLNDLVSGHMIKIDVVLTLNITTDQVIKRLDKRRICLVCKKIYHLETDPPKDMVHCDNPNHPKTKLIKRPDDEEDVVRHRINIYTQETAPLINYYRNNKKVKFFDVDASKTENEVYEQAKKALGW